MAEENGGDTIALEDMELRNGDMMVIASDDSIHHRKMEFEDGDEECTDKLVVGKIDVVEEGGQDLRSSSDIAEGINVNTSPPEETDLVEGQLRRKPTAIIIGPNHKFNVQSRYLSASFSSCHDLCKYGHKHETEKKTRRPMLGTIREAQSLARTTSDDLAKCMLEKETKKKELFRRLSLPGPIPEKSPIEKMNLSKTDTNRSKLKRVQSEIKPSSAPSPRNSSRRSKTDNIQAVKKPVGGSSNFQESSSQKVKQIKSMKHTGNSCSKDEKEKAKEPISNSPKTPLKKSPSIKARLYKNLKSSSRSRNHQINSQEAEINTSDDVPEKTLYVIEPNNDSNPAKKSSDITSPSENLPSTPRISRVSNTKGSKGNHKGTGISLSSSSCTQESPQTRGKKQHGLEATKTKQIGTVTEDGGLKTSTLRAKSTANRKMKDLVSVNTKHSGRIREDGGSKTDTSRAKSTVDHKMKAKRSEKSCPEEKDGSAWKVKFKRGTVVALQVANSAPKKLRFKRGRILGEDQIAKAEVDRKLKNKYDIGDGPHDTRPETGKVRLRHQEASGKKDNIDLNNVIEETASKLVKTRKSKVKALVGAFETVMSLRDRKPSLETIPS